MRKYRRKAPEIIEAELFMPTSPYPWPKGVEAVLVTRRGRLRVMPGDYVITDRKGQRYPISPDTFHAKYEPVESFPPVTDDDL